MPNQFHCRRCTPSQSRSPMGSHRLSKSQQGLSPQLSRCRQTFWRTCFHPTLWHQTFMQILEILSSQTQTAQW